MKNIRPILNEGVFFFTIHMYCTVIDKGEFSDVCNTFQYIWDISQVGISFGVFLFEIFLSSGYKMKSEIMDFGGQNNDVSKIV
jgi:hypothetical protein